MPSGGGEKHTSLRSLQPARQRPNMCQIDAELLGSQALLRLHGANVRDDDDLIRDTLGGCTESFGQLVGKYQDRLFNTMVHVIGAREEAEDVCQEAFVQAFVKLNTFAGNSTFYTWLYRIAFNTMASRRRRKRPVASVDVARELAGVEPVDASEEATESLERAERSQHLHAAIAELSDEHRDVIVLREMEGQDYETISDVLHVPIGTVRSRLHRARSQLRDQLRDILEQPS